MRLKLKFNIKGLEAKLRKNVNQYIERMIEDAAEYLARKIREELISGQFVGVRTGNLRAGTHTEKVDGKVNVVSDMDYTEHVVNYTIRKYGTSYFEMARQIYGDNLAKIIQEKAKDVYKKNYQYVNPFP